MRDWMNVGTSGSFAAAAGVATASATTNPSAIFFTSPLCPSDVRALYRLREVIDLRSDTMTRPSSGMREAMACAEVGDEQWLEDPTVSALERRAAVLLGHEAAVYVPTATMANQIA